MSTSESSVRQRASAAGIAALKVLSVVWLVIHFTLTVLHVMPLNPLTNQVRAQSNALLGPLFAQNWSLFAPDPVSTDLILLVRPLSAPEEQAYAASGVLPDDGWYDLSSPLWARFQANRFSAYDRLARVHSTAIRQYLSGGIDLVSMSRSCQKGDADACDAYGEAFDERRELASDLLGRTASAFCRDLAAAGPGCGRVALRVRSVSSVPWSDRYTASPDTVDVDVAVLATDPTAAPMGVFSFPPSLPLAAGAQVSN